VKNSPSFNKLKIQQQTVPSKKHKTCFFENVFTKRGKSKKKRKMVMVGGRAERNFTTEKFYNFEKQ